MTDRHADERAHVKPKREALYAKEYKIAQSLIKGDNFENSRGPRLYTASLPDRAPG